MKKVVMKRNEGSYIHGGERREFIIDEKVVFLTLEKREMVKGAYEFYADDKREKFYLFLTGQNEMFLELKSYEEGKIAMKRIHESHLGKGYNQDWDVVFKDLLEK